MIPEIKMEYYGDMTVSNLVVVGPDYTPTASAAEPEVKRALASGRTHGDVLAYLEDGCLDFFGVFHRVGEGGQDLREWLHEFTENRADALGRR